MGRWRGGWRRLRSFSPPLQIPEVGRSDLHLGELDGMLVALPVEPVDALGRGTGQTSRIRTHTPLMLHYCPGRLHTLTEGNSEHRRHKDTHNGGAQ